MTPKTMTAEDGTLLIMCTTGYDGPSHIPECGEWYPIDAARCPQCDAENLEV